MKKIDNFRSWYTATVASSFCILVAVYIPEASKVFGLQISSLIAFIFVIIAVLSFQKILDLSIDSSKLIRRLILGNNFVEGYWVDYSVLNRTGKVIGGALQVKRGHIFEL